MKETGEGPKSLSTPGDKTELEKSDAEEGHADKGELKLQNFLFSIETVAPIFLVVLLGMVLRRWRVINEAFLDMASIIVFRISLPAMVFIKIAGADFQQAFDPLLIGFGIGGTLLFFGVTWFVSIPVTKNGAARGSLIQGAFRGNFAIIGFAMVLNLHGESGLAKAAILLSFIMPLYNVLAVIALTLPKQHGQSVGRKKMVTEIITNPLIAAGIIGIVFSFLGFSLGRVVNETGNYLSAMALPLALIGVGGSLDLRSIRQRIPEKLTAVGLKLIVCPLIFIPLAYWAGIRGEDLVILFSLFAAPTAVVSYIMARSMDGDTQLAADIVLLSTLGSVATLSAGVFMMKTFGII